MIPATATTAPCTFVTGPAATNYEIALTPGHVGAAPPREPRQNRAERRRNASPKAPRSVRHEADTDRAVAWWRKEWHVHGRTHTIPVDLAERVMRP